MGSQLPGGDVPFSPSSASLLAASLASTEGRLPSERDDGAVEYKLRLTGVTSERLERLITQLKWRLSEGCGRCFYELGITDDGFPCGLTAAELEESLDTLRKMCKLADAEVSKIERRELQPGASVDTAFGSGEKSAGGRRWTKAHRFIRMDETPLFVAECLVIKLIGSRPMEAGRPTFEDVRVAFVGPHDSGKSTLLGVLTHGEPDNARGRARLNLLRHQHEIVSGRTSSVSQQLLGFDVEGALISWGRTWENIVEQAARVVELIDTCGHPKYARTTISALAGRKPDFVCLVTPAKHERSDNFGCELLEYCGILGIPFFVVVSKIDTLGTMSDATKSRLLESLAETLNRTPGELVSFSTAEDVPAMWRDFALGKTTPVIFTSSVAGDGLDLLLHFLRGLGKSSPGANLLSSDHGFELQVEEVFNPPSVGLVVSGVVSGCFSTRTSNRDTGMRYFLGPMRDGGFVRVRITSIHRQRVPVVSVRSGDAASFAVEQIEEADDADGHPVMFALEDDLAHVPDVTGFRCSPSLPWSDQEPLQISTDCNSATIFGGRQSPTTARTFRRGQVLLSVEAHSRLPRGAEEFEADMEVLSLPKLSMSHSQNHTTHIGITVGQCGVVHIGSVRQTVSIVGLRPLVSGEEERNRRRTSVPDGARALVPAALADRVLFLGERARVRMRFASEPEWLRPGWSLIFRHGKTLARGMVVTMVL